MRSIVFEGKTSQAYEALRERDKKQHLNLCQILKEMQRNDPRFGLGKPEPLRHQLGGLWSRRLSHRDRLVYSFDNETIRIFLIGGHYDSF